MDGSCPISCFSCLFFSLSVFFHLFLTLNFRSVSPSFVGLYHSRTRVTENVSQRWYHRTRFQHVTASGERNVVHTFLQQQQTNKLIADVTLLLADWWNARLKRVANQSRGTSECLWTGNCKVLCRQHCGGRSLDNL